MTRSSRRGAAQATPRMHYVCPAGVCETAAGRTGVAAAVACVDTTCLPRFRHVTAPWPTGERGGGERDVQRVPVGRHERRAAGRRAAPPRCANQAIVASVDRGVDEVCGPGPGLAAWADEGWGRGVH